jgi:hypothetical protein
VKSRAIARAAAIDSLRGRIRVILAATNVDDNTSREGPVD